VHTTSMTALLDRLLGLWQEPVDKRDDPEAAFRELYADPVSINATPMPVSSLVERARALQRAFDGRTTEIVDPRGDARPGGDRVLHARRPASTRNYRLEQAFPPGANRL
jgi:hypothetical protein